jgi:hypothetical protein
MTTTSAIPLSVNGTRLDTFAYNIETIEGRIGVSNRRGANPIVPGRHGSIFLPNKTFEDANIVLKMWVIGADVNGAVPNGSSELAEFRKNIDALTLLFSGTPGLLDVRQVWPAGTRQALCEVLQSYDLSGRAVQPVAAFSVALNIPGVFWQDVLTSDYSSSTGLTSGTTVTMAVYDGATAPMEDHMVVVSGPATNPRLIDPVTGSWVQYNGTIATGTDWQVDAANYTSRVGSSLLFTVGGGTNAIASTSTGGGGQRLITLQPRAGGPQLTFTCTSPGAGTQVRARGRRKFLT